MGQISVFRRIASVNGTSISFHNPLLINISFYTQSIKEWTVLINLKSPTLILQASFTNRKNIIVSITTPSTISYMVSMYVMHVFGSTLIPP